MRNSFTNVLKAAICLLACFGTNFAYAQESQSLTVCDGTDENKYIPFYFYYLDNADATSQVIYPASELEALKGKQITGMKFYNAGYSSAWSSSMAVSLAEVDFSGLAEDNAAYISADFQEVFSGAMSGDETMNTLEFTFSTPFVYTGKNLVVEIKNTEVGSTYMQVPFYGVNVTTEYNATYGYSSSFKYNERFLPKVTVTYQDVQQFGAKVSAESLDFATIFTGSESVKEFTVSNTGASDLTATISGIESPYSVAQTTFSLPSLTSISVPVTFAPAADGSYSQTMAIDLGQAGTFNVELSGNSMTAPTGYRQTFEVEDKNLPENWTGWNVKGTYDYGIGDYIFESAEAHTEYFVGKEIDGVKAISIYEDANPRREYPSQYEIYMISPVVHGNVMITARTTNSPEYIAGEVKAYKAAMNDDGSFTISNEPIEITWTTPLSNTAWSNGIFSLSEPTQVAVFMSYGAVSEFAADGLGYPAVEAGIEFSADGLTYVTKADNTAGVIAVASEVTECTVPETVNYNGVTLTVNSIERDAFYWSNVKSVRLPDSMETIGYGAFRSSPLESIELPANVKEIGEYAFYKTNISAITLPEGVTKIATSTFSQCELLASVTLPTSLTEIGQGAFYKTAITTLQLPDACSTLGMYAFESCSKLASITLPQGLTEIPMGLFQGCASLTDVSLPESVTTIKEAAFQGAAALSAIHFPKNVADIEANAFNDVPLTTITVAEDNAAYSVIDGALYSADKRFIVLYPRITETKAYDIIDGCVAVLGGAFYDCDIKSVTFPDDFIGIDAFGFCYSDLETVNLPNSIQEIWAQAFAGTKLTEVIMPQGVTRLNEAVFADCEKLAVVTLPAGLTDVGNRAFYRCTSLTTINCLGTVPSEFDAWETYTNPFFEVDCSKVTVKCPTESVDAYKASEWGDFFTTIEGSDFSKIESVATDGISISATNGVISISAAGNADCNIIIANVNGSVTHRINNAGSSFSTGSLPRGVYVVAVTVGNSTVTRKVIL